MTHLKSHHHSTGNLKIGDTVLLFYDAYKRLEAGSGDTCGYVLADLSGCGLRQLLIVQPSESSGPDLPTIQCGTFRLLAANKYDAQTRYHTLLEKLDEFKRKKVGQNAIQVLQLQVIQAKRDSEVETAENEANQKRLKGTSINYGDSIQLLHTLTEKNVCVSYTETSIIENSKLKVYLQRKDSKGCIFRLHPHIKVQIVGEEVNYNDYIKFESLALEGRFLHCSKRTFKDVNININSHCNEINVASKVSPLKMIRHYQATKKSSSDGVLRASGIVRFFHRKHQCCIVGEGSFAGRYASIAALADIPDAKETISEASEGRKASLSTLGMIVNLASKHSSLRRCTRYSEVNPPTLYPINENDTDVSTPSVCDQSIVLSSCPDIRVIFNSTVMQREDDCEDMYDDVVLGDVHFRSRRKLCGISTPPSMSPKTFWQIEKLHDPTSGESMKWSEKCRIRHLPTKRYLAVTDDTTNYKVTLRSQKLDASKTVFELFPVVQQVDGDIGYESYVRVKHSETGTWLHLDKDLQYIPEGGIDIEAEYDLAEDGTGIRELYQVVAHKEINSDDVFILQKVEDKLVTDYNYMAGITDVLTHQLQQCETLGSNRPHFSEVCHIEHTLSSLYYLNSLLLKDKHTMGTKLKLLREMKILVLVVRLLKLHRDDNNNNDSEVATACFEIISTFLEGKSNKNKIYISQIIQHIFTKSLWETELGGDLTIEKMLTGITKNNASLLYEVDFIKNVSWHLVQKLKSMDKSSERIIQLFDGLSVLCACKGSPIKQNQMIILKNLQAAYGSGEEQENMILYPLRIRPSDEEDGTDGRIRFSDQVTVQLEDHDSPVTTILANPLVDQMARSNSEDHDSPVTTTLANPLVDQMARSNSEDHDSPVTTTLANLVDQMTRRNSEDHDSPVTTTLANPLVDQMARSNSEDHDSPVTTNPLVDQMASDVVQFQQLFSAQNKRVDCGNWCDFGKGNKVFHKIFLAELRLLVMMCKGDNKAVIDALQGSPGTQGFGIQITFPIIMCAISDADIKELHPDLRAMLVELLKVMYVEVGENLPILEKFPFSFIIDEVTYDSISGKKRKTTALTGIENVHFPVIHQWIQSFFNDESEYFFAADENSENGVVVKVLQLLAVLVKYGYYDDVKDVKSILPSIFKLLDGKRDFPTKLSKQNFEAGALFSPTEPTFFQHKTFQRSSRRSRRSRRHWRHRIHRTSTDDDILPTLVDFSQESIQKALSEFQEKGGRYKYQEKYQNYFEIKRWALMNLNLFFNFQSFKDIHAIIQDFRSLSPSADNNNADESGSLEGDKGVAWNLEEKLHQLLSIEVQDNSPGETNGLSEAAIRYLNLMRHERGDPDLTNGDQLPETLLDLANYEYDDLIQYSLLLLDRHYTSVSDIFQKASQVCLLETEESRKLYKEVQGMMYKITTYLKVASTAGVDEPEMLSPIKFLTENCWLEGEIEGFEPHQINQNIILSFGILPDILKYVVHQCSTNSFSKLESMKIIECIAFLRALACKNQEIQKRLLPHIDVFVYVASGELGPSICELLNEIFSGGPSISLSVPEEQIGSIMRLIFAKGRERFSRVNATLLSALQQLLKVKELDLPLKHNQMIVARNFSLLREDDRYWCKDLISEDKRRFRWDVLTSEDQSNCQLTNLLMITDLLVACAFGDNPSANSICCTIYNEEELIRIIRSPRIPIYCKRPFMKFLVTVYMNVEGEMIQERSYFFRNNKGLWEHITEMATVLQEMSKVMKDMPHPSYLSVKELIVDPSWKYLHECPNRKHLQSPPTIILHDHQEFSISDALLYISEGFFPFLQVFYKKFYKQSHSREQFEKEETTTEQIYKALLHMHSPLISQRVYFPSEVQVRQYYRALLIIRPFFTSVLDDELMKLDEYIEFDCSPDANYQELVSEAREDYNKTYANEIQLNARFNEFIAKFKSFYEGKNTRRDQVLKVCAKQKLSDTEPYSEFLDKEETIPGPRRLPLGPHFQEHVDIFKVSCPEVECTRNPKERLLKQLEISFHKLSHDSDDGIDKERQAQLDIKCLQILRATIYNAIIQIDVEDKERDPEHYRKQCALHVHPIQNEIQDLGNAIVRVLPIFFHPNKVIVRQAMAFIEVLLELGNTHVQEALKYYLQVHESQLFIILYRALNEVALKYRERQQLISQLKARIAFDKTICADSFPDDPSPYDQRESRDVFNNLSYRMRDDGSVLLMESLKRGSTFINLFQKQTVSLMNNGDERIPFLALYQSSNMVASVGEKAASFLQFCDFSRIEMMLKVLGLCCDGQNRAMQNFAREQSKAIHTINVVSVITSLFYELTEKHKITSDTFPLFIQTLQCLIEMCAGNYKNHEVVFNEHIISAINFILQIDITNIKPRSEDLDHLTTEDNSKINYIELRVNGLKLKASAIELLEVITEDISPKSKMLCQQISEGLDIHGLHLSMVEFMILKDDKDLIHLQYEDNASRSLFKIYKILMHLVDNGAGSLDSLMPSEKNALVAWKYCEKKSHSIEIIYRDQENPEEEVLTRVHFDPNIKTHIAKHLMDSVQYNVDRSTHNEKMRDFLEWMNAVKKHVLHRDWLKSSHLRPITFFSKIRYWCLLLLTVIINLTVLFTFKAPSPNISPITVPDPKNLDAVKYVTGSLHLILSIWMVLEYFVVTFPHFVLPKFLYKVHLVPHSFQHYRLTAWLTKIHVLPRLNRNYTSVNIIGIKSLYVIIFLLVSIISIADVKYFGYLYPICLLYIVFNNDILQRTLQAVTKNWKSLFWVAMLLLAILSIYSVTAFAVFQRDFVISEHQFCETLAQCFISVLRFGLIDNFLEVDFDNNTDIMRTPAQELPMRFLFDVTFFIIITTIGLNIVFGIIVDTFSELRDARFKAEEDMHTNCFICSLPSHEFEKISNQSFRMHIENDHNMWSYIYYSIYLDQVDISDHNAIEKYVYEKLRNGEIDFLPFKRALVLEGQDDGEELKKELDDVIKERFMNLQFRLDALEELINSKIN